MAWGAKTHKRAKKPKLKVRGKKTSVMNKFRVKY